MLFRITLYLLPLACTQLLVSKPNEDNFAVYISLLEKALNKEVSFFGEPIPTIFPGNNDYFGSICLQAFTAQQKKRLQSWKQQCIMSVKRFNLRRGSQDRGR